MKITKNQKNFCLLEVLFSLYRIYWQKFRSLAKENVPRKGSKTESTRVCNDVQGLPNCAQQQQQQSSTVTQSQMNCETQTQMKDNKQTEIGSKQLEQMIMYHIRQKRHNCRPDLLVSIKNIWSMFGGHWRPPSCAAKLHSLVCLGLWFTIRI